ncbi:hypothetical protein ABKN59_002549 [Abortiporus biennis]
MDQWSFVDELGALLTGLIVATFLYGIGTLQAYIYFTKYPQDRVELKLWVGAVWAIDTANIALVCRALYKIALSMILGAEAGASSMTSGKRSLDISSGFNVLVAVLVQIFFVKRIYQLCRAPTRYWLAGILTILVATHFGLGSDAVVQVINAFNSDHHPDPVEPLAGITFSAVVPYTIAAVLSDVAISVVLIIVLRARRSEFESMNSVVDRLMNFSLTRCVVVSVAALVRLITYVAVPGTLWFVATDFIMGKLYAISLMSLLNSRRASLPATTESDLETPVFTTVMIEPTGVTSTAHGLSSRITELIGESTSIPGHDISLNIEEMKDLSSPDTPIHHDNDPHNLVGSLPIYNTAHVS